MKKNLMFVVSLFVLVLLAGCGKYTKAAGTYELYSLTGDVSLSYFKYYTIKLDSKGTFVAKAEYTGNTTLYDSKGTFTLKENQLVLSHIVDSKMYNETCEYFGGEIIMEVKQPQVKFVAKFRRSR